VSVATRENPANRRGLRRGGGGRRKKPHEPARISPPGAPPLPRRLTARKAARQERSRATVEAILGAAVDVFASRGYARTSTNLIARRAGISVGSLYQYFPNKDAILTTLLGRHLRAVEAAIRECLPAFEDAGVPLRSGFRSLLTKLLELHESDPRLTRAVEHEAGQMPRVPEAFGHYEQAYLADLERILRGRADVRAGDRAVMAQLLFEATEAASGWLAHGPADRFDRDTALDEATELLCRYVERAQS
jgi:AcrR family transcriptional regulator